MASLITSGNKMAKDIGRLMNKFDMNLEDALACYWKTFNRDIRYGLLQANAYAKIKKEMIDNGELPELYDPEKLQRTYFITIRPDEKSISFANFYTLIINFVKRSCFDYWELSFEQKGTTPETLGSGFHTHILARMRQRSKGEVLRNTISTFKNCTSANCIQVDVVKTQKDYDNCKNYFTKYESDDGHKIETKDWDTQWRENLGLKSTYCTIEDHCISNILPPIKSIMGQDVNNNTYIVDLT